MPRTRTHLPAARLGGAGRPLRQGGARPLRGALTVGPGIRRPDQLEALEHDRRVRRKVRPSRAQARVKQRACSRRQLARVRSSSPSSWAKAASTRSNGTVRTSVVRITQRGRPAPSRTTLWPPTTGSGSPAASNSRTRAAVARLGPCRTRSRLVLHGRVVAEQDIVPRLGRPAVEPAELLPKGFGCGLLAHRPWSSPSPCPAGWLPGMVHDSVEPRSFTTQAATKTRGRRRPMSPATTPSSTG